MALWLDPMLSGPPLREIQTTRITYEHAYLIWTDQRRIKLLDKYHLEGSRSQPSAVHSARVYWEAKNKLQAEVWQRCLTGELTVMATNSDGGLEILAPSILEKTWPDGPCLDSRFNKIEILGRTPDWLLQKPGDQSEFIHQIVPEFRATDDYQLVVIRKLRFELGPVQAGVVRVLHRASFSTDQTMLEGEIRHFAPFVGSISDLFKRQRNWPELIKKVARARYRLNLFYQPSWTDWEDTVWARMNEIKAGVRS